MRNIISSKEEILLDTVSEKEYAMPFTIKRTHRIKWFYVGGEALECGKDGGPLKRKNAGYF